MLYENYRVIIIDLYVLFYFSARSVYESESSDEQSDDSGVTDETQAALRVGGIVRKSINKGRWSKEEVCTYLPLDLLIIRLLMIQDIHNFI